MFKSFYLYIILAIFVFLGINTFPPSIQAHSMNVQTDKPINSITAYNSGNTLSNGGFEKNNLSEKENNVMGNLPWITSNSGGNTITVTNEKSKKGKHSLLWSTIGWNTKDNGKIEDAGTFIFTSLRKYTKMGADKAQISGYINTEHLNPKFKIQITLANGQFTMFNADTVIKGGKNGWQYFKAAMPITKDDKSMLIAFMALNTKGAGALNSKVYIDDLKLIYTGKQKIHKRVKPKKVNENGQSPVPIGLNHIPKFNQSSSRKMAEELNLNFIVGTAQWIEPKPGNYIWSMKKKDDFLSHLKWLKKQGYTTSMTFTNVHMDKKHLPKYLEGKSFNDPYLLERWGKYLKLFLARYGDYIDHLNIGNEVNNYFGSHQNEWSEYLAFLKHSEKIIRKTSPRISIGVVLTDARREYYWGQIEKYCDHLAVTYYTPCSIFSKSPTKNALDKNHDQYFANTLNRAIDISGDKKILITEVGCATHPDLDSSPELQAEFIKKLFLWANDKGDDVLGISWLSPKDWPYKGTQKALKGFLGAELLQHKQFMKYLTSLGLKYEDGREKMGYKIFKNEIKKHQSITK